MATRCFESGGTPATCMYTFEILFSTNGNLYVFLFWLRGCTLCPLVDINKFLWMVRIGGSTEKGSHIKEADYFTPQGEFRVDREGSPILLNCLMYKMCYYRFGQVYTEQGLCFGSWSGHGLKGRGGHMCLHLIDVVSWVCLEFLEVVIMKLVAM